MKALVLFAIMVSVFTVVGAKRAMLMGGNVASDNNELWTLCVELSGAAADSRIGIITAGAVDPAAAFSAYSTELLARGAVEVYWIPVHMANLTAASDPDIVNHIYTLTGFFFGGEDGQSTWFVDSLFEGSPRVDTPVLAAIRARWSQLNTYMVIGTGVGTQALTSGPMVISGRSYDALIHGSFPRNASSIPTDAVVYDPLGGLGFITNYVLDAYFGQQSNEGRLNRMMADTIGLYPNSLPYALGVDEDTALIVNDVGETVALGEVKGVGGVTALDASEIIVDNLGTYQRVDNMIYHYMTYNDTLEMPRLIIHYALDKTNLDGNENQPNEYNSDDVFGGQVQGGNNPTEFVDCATSIFNAALPVSAYGTTGETVPAMMKVDFLETDTRKTAAINSAGKISYTYMLVSMYEA